MLTLIAIALCCMGKVFQCGDDQRNLGSFKVPVTIDVENVLSACHPKWFCLNSGKQIQCTEVGQSMGSSLQSHCFTSALCLF